MILWATVDLKLEIGRVILGDFYSPVVGLYRFLISEIRTQGAVALPI